ncbi:hypothetical protein Bbelb_243060 [Branchiostoma belcheri]|nr:hypothetical protein Bbelb_243060 [Branchiostoma belcheri]
MGRETSGDGGALEPETTKRYRTRSGNTKTKAWNTPAKDIPQPETIIEDHTDANKSKVCSLKFRTSPDRVPMWIDVSKAKFDESFEAETGHKFTWKGSQLSIIDPTKEIASKSWLSTTTKPEQSSSMAIDRVRLRYYIDRESSNGKNTHSCINTGMPADGGTLLGPLLFLVVFDDAMRQASVGRWKYVDDLSLAESHRYNKPSVMQMELNNFQDWSLHNHMLLNPDKCKAMVICFMKYPPPLPVLTINQTQLEVVCATCLLGVWIQKNLKWDMHVDKTINKANGRLAMLRKIKRFSLSTEDLLQIYITYVRSVLEYCVPVWHSGLTATQTTRLERIQRRALRTILGMNYTDYKSALLNTGLKSLQERRVDLCLKFARNLSPEMLPPRTGDSHGITTRNSDKLRTIKCKTKRYRDSPIPGCGMSGHKQGDPDCQYLTPQHQEAEIQSPSAEDVIEESFRLYVEKEPAAEPSPSTSGNNEGCHNNSNTEASQSTSEVPADQRGNPTTQPQPKRDNKKGRRRLRDASRQQEGHNEREALTRLMKEARRRAVTPSTPRKRGLSRTSDSSPPTSQKKAGRGAAVDGDNNT